MSTETCIQMFVGALVLTVANMEPKHPSTGKGKQTALSTQWNSRQRTKETTDINKHQG